MGTASDVLVGLEWSAWHPTQTHACNGYLLSFFLSLFFFFFILFYLNIFSLISNHVVSIVLAFHPPFESIVFYFNLGKSWGFFSFLVIYISNMEKYLLFHHF